MKKRTGMIEEELRRVLPTESENVEWKRSLGEWKDIVVSAAAMATVHGGQIFIGVEPTGKVYGIQIGKGTLEDLANKIAQNTGPRLTPSITTSERDGKTIIVVGVTESASKPVYAFDRPYRRSGRTNQRLSQEEALRSFMANRGITWDQSAVTDASVAEDIDPALVRRFLLAARRERRWEVSEETSVE
jgi:ATP-dependent DNA helicase RecG